MYFHNIGLADYSTYIPITYDIFCILGSIGLGTLWVRVKGLLLAPLMIVLVCCLCPKILSNYCDLVFCDHCCGGNVLRWVLQHYCWAFHNPTKVCLSSSKEQVLASILQWQWQSPISSLPSHSFWLDLWLGKVDIKIIKWAAHIYYFHGVLRLSIGWVHMGGV